MVQAETVPANWLMSVQCPRSRKFHLAVPWGRQRTLCGRYYNTTYRGEVMFAWESERCQHCLRMKERHASILNFILQTQPLLSDKRELATKETLNPMELARLSEVNAKLDGFDFTTAIRHPLYGKLLG